MEDNTLFDILLKVSELRMDIETAERKIHKYVETLLPTEEEIKQDLTDMGWLIGDDFPINEILEDIIIVIKSRLAGKEE